MSQWLFRSTGIRWWLRHLEMLRVSGFFYILPDLTRVRVWIARHLSTLSRGYSNAHLGTWVLLSYVQNIDSRHYYTYLFHFNKQEARYALFVLGKQCKPRGWRQTQEAGPKKPELYTHHYYLRQPHSGSTGTSTTFKESKCKMGNQDDDRNDRKTEYPYFLFAKKKTFLPRFWSLMV